MPDKVHVTRDGNVLRLKLDDGKANTIEHRWIAELSAALDEAERSPQTAVLLEGRPGRFCAGLDLKVLPSLGREGVRDVVRKYQSLMLRLFLFPRPVVCAIGGHAIAGGAIVALASDFRVMAQGEFQIGLREVAIGITLPTFGCELAKAVLPASSWTRAVLRGELFSPHAALDVGFVDEVVGAESASEAALVVAGAMARLPDAAYAATKRMLRAEFRDRMLAAAEPDLETLTAAIPAS